MKKNKSKSTLNKQIERESATEIKDNYDDFIVDLFQTMQAGIQLPDIDLASSKSAQETSERLTKTLSNLKQYQHQVRSLRSVLEKKRWELEQS